MFEFTSLFNSEIKLFVVALTNLEIKLSAVLSALNSITVGLDNPFSSFIKSISSSSVPILSASLFDTAWVPVYVLPSASFLTSSSLKCLPSAIAFTNLSYASLFCSCKIFLVYSGKSSVKPPTAFWSPERTVSCLIPWSFKNFWADT